MNQSHVKQTVTINSVCLFDMKPLTTVFHPWSFCLLSYITAPTKEVLCNPRCGWGDKGKSEMYALPVLLVL